MEPIAIKNRKLADAKTLQEATKILDANNVGKTSAIRKLVGLAYKMTDESDKKHTLQEADESMGKDEKPYDSRGPQKNAKNQIQSDELNKEARENSGDESQLHGNPSGDPGSDVPNPANSGREDQKNALEQTGDSQLGGANKENAMPYYQMMGQNPSPDLLNKKIIELMDPTNGAGMSKVAAEQQAGTLARDQMGFMQEALKPVLTKMWEDRTFLMKQNHDLQEAINILKTSKAGSISLMKTSGPGGNVNKEALIPGTDPTVSESALQLEKIASDPLAKETLQRDIMEQYIN